MKKQDYPNYYIAGDAASTESQNNYIRLVGIDLLLMIASAALSVYNYQSEESKSAVYIISGILLFFALLLSIILKVKKFEDSWYSGRALAESCKTLTWRYIMRSEDFEDGISEIEAKKRFQDKIRKIKDQFTDLNKVINTKNLNLPIITSEMERVRNLALNERKDFYLDSRIQNQIKWYSSKAENNIFWGNFWFYVIISLQFLALISIVYLIKCPMSNFNLVGLFSTISASGFSWLQVKRYQENKEAYTMANSELNLIKAEAERITNEDEFSKYVLDSENAMSREHTMWLAQKRI
jgi:hypothetical protein